MATKVSNPPTTERGKTAGEVGSTLGFLPWTSFIDSREFVPELKWPGSVMAYERMRTDSQLAALFWAMTAPIRRYKFLLEPNGARPEIVTAIAEDLNIDIVGEEPKPRGRKKGRFSHDAHLHNALLALQYGHAFFEQYGEIVDGLWRLRKLAVRPQHSISEINIAEDGGLISIKQAFTEGLPTGNMIEIGVDRLVAYVWDMDNANWVGRSMFRDCYRNWLIKDRLMRVDAINHERAGGVPWAEAAPGASVSDIKRLSEMAQQFKVGEDSGGAVPAGAKLNIARLGAGTDVIGSIRYHDEAMARRWMMMWIELGMTQTGSRALGQSFVEQAMIAQKAVAQWYCDITSEHVIEDWVDWNYGEDEENVPLLTYIIEEEDEYLAVADLVSLVREGVISVDPELEDYIRHRFMLPEAQAPGTGLPQPQPQLPNDVVQAVVASLDGEIKRYFRENGDRLLEEASA